MGRIQNPVDDSGRAGIGESISTQVVSEVAAVTGEQPTDMDQLHQTLDADALNKLYESEFSGTVTFEFAGCTVLIDSTGTVEAKPGETVSEPDDIPNCAQVD